MKKSFGIIILTIIISCGGGSGGIFAEDIIPRWDHTGLDIAGNPENMGVWIIAWGDQSGNYTSSIAIPIAGANCKTNTTYLFFDCYYPIILDAEPGTYYVVVKTIDASGNPSEYSNEATKTIELPDTVNAAEPQNVRF